MYRVDRNNFYDNSKNATVYTPSGVSEFLFSILHGNIATDRQILDPCVGAGSLLKPFANAGYGTTGIDIEIQGWPDTINKNFLAIKSGDLSCPALVIANPPFNMDEKTRILAVNMAGARPLLPEVWLRHIINLWGKEVPICLFAPYGLRLNQTVNSKRWQAFVNGEYPEISSIISLPKNIYRGVLFHSEILIFNVNGLKSHYFYHS